MECSPTLATRPAACATLVQNNKDRDTALTDERVSWLATGVLGVATVATYLLWPKSDAVLEPRARVVIAPWLVGARGGAVRVEF